MVEEEGRGTRGGERGRGVGGGGGGRAEKRRRKKELCTEALGQECRVTRIWERKGGEEREENLEEQR